MSPDSPSSEAISNPDGAEVTTATIAAAGFDAIAGGYHGDAFALMGPHQTSAGWEIRAFLPQAAHVELLVDGRLYPMAHGLASGIYVVTMPSVPSSYQLRVRHHDGTEALQDDPYRFPPLATEHDLYLFGEGTNYEAQNLLGAHLHVCLGVHGVRFAVWAPYAEVVSVVGDFNGWDTRRNPMRKRTGGIWEIFVPNLGPGAVYKYFIRSSVAGYRVLKADPYAFAAEVPPKTGSRVAKLDYDWRDGEWMTQRAQTDWLRAPMSIYEVHLGSWQRDGPRELTYRELAERLVPYIKDLGYTHIELLPVAEHPFGGSWGYQVTGYFAPTSRHGSPAEFKFFVDECHRAGIGVIVDWVPGHFPKDEHGLAFFDGTGLYEHEDPRKGEHPQWGTNIFNYGRNEVRCFLVSNALFWLREYHIDGLRVDAVASMLYLDYARESGQWIPNREGGNVNLEAVDFLRIFNEQAHKIPGALTIAEESTSFYGVSRPVYAGGLGFTLKWNMGWMHDMLKYFSEDPLYRRYHHNQVTFSLMYAFTENFVLPISHDEVVHMKGSFLGKMPGDEWQRFANARLFLGYMWAHPGKKLLFMGCEVGQYEEWNEAVSIRLDLQQYDLHRGLQDFNRALNHFYRSRAALYQVDFDWQGFEWLSHDDVEASVIAFLRWSSERREFIIVICNFTPVVRHGYRLGVPMEGVYHEVMNSDGAAFGGGGIHNGELRAEGVSANGRNHSISVSLPPLAVVMFERRSA